jgi:uncharacterized membrane protein
MKRIFPIIAVILALVGLSDSIYLTVHHLTAEPVPCNLVEGCETVLTSAYATIAGIPLAAFGALAYFAAFALALLAAYGNGKSWLVFGLQAAFMALFSAWLIFVQAFYIHAFCQFCLLSAGTSFMLFIIFILSKVFRQKPDLA